MNILPREFYQRCTVDVAKDLLGKILVRQVQNIIISGIITETEAYRFDDPASHTYRGKTQRNKAMFGEEGRVYIYFTYGMHYCINAVAKDSNSPAGGVLFRALKPYKGIEMMKKNRKTEQMNNLTSGPAKITKAFSITKEHYGIDLTKSSEIYITEGIQVKNILSGPRIGITKAIEKKWNFKIEI